MARQGAVKEIGRIVRLKSVHWVLLGIAFWQSIGNAHVSLHAMLVQCLKFYARFDFASMAISPSCLEKPFINLSSKFSADPVYVGSFFACFSCRWYVPGEGFYTVLPH